MAAWKPGIEFLLWFCNYGYKPFGIVSSIWLSQYMTVYIHTSLTMVIMFVEEKTSDILSLARTHICLCIINDGAMRLIGSNIILFINYLLWRTEIWLTLLQKYWYLLYFSGCWVIHRRCRYFIKENPSWMGKVCFCVPI